MVQFDPLKSHNSTRLIHKEIINFQWNSINLRPLFKKYLGLTLLSIPSKSFNPINSIYFEGRESNEKDFTICFNVLFDIF